MHDVYNSDDALIQLRLIGMLRGHKAMGPAMHRTMRYIVNYDLFKLFEMLLHWTFGADFFFYYIYLLKNNLS